MHDELERRKLTNSPLSQASILSIFHSLCSAIRELHQANPPIAHRDIKVCILIHKSFKIAYFCFFQPHNVLLDKDLRPVLMDFGSCAPARVSVRNMREAQYLQDTAAERCSMCYRPPELFQVDSNCDIDERTDIWVGDVISKYSK